MNKQTNNKSLISLPLLIVVLCVLVILFGIGCGFDFNISKTLFSTNKTTNSIIGGIISNIGINIGNFALYTAAISFIIASYAYVNKQRWKTITVNVVCIFALLVFTVICGFSISEWKAVAGTQIGGIVINISVLVLDICGGFCLSWFVVRKLDQEQVFKAMFWLIIFLIAVSIIRTALCVIWSRPRPKAVFDQANPVDFKPVWILDPFRCWDKSCSYHSLCKSFPSGHTAMSATIIGLIVVLIKLKTFKNKTINLIVLICGILIMFLTGFGRMLAGWHFLTDTSFGALLGVATYSGLSALLAKRKIG